MKVKLITLFLIIFVSKISYSQINNSIYRKISAKNLRISNDFEELLDLYRIYYGENLDSSLILIEISFCDNKYFADYKFYPKVIGAVEVSLFNEAKKINSYLVFDKNIEILYITVSDYVINTSRTNNINFVYSSFYSPTLYQWEIFEGVIKRSFGFCLDDNGNKRVQPIDKFGYAY